MASSLESITEFCCSLRRHDDENSNADDSNKGEAANYELSEELTEVESTTDELPPEFGYSDEGEEKIERVKNRINESEDEEVKEEQEKEIDLSITGTKNEVSKSGKHLDCNGNKHVDLNSGSQKSVYIELKDTPHEDKKSESESSGKETNTERKIQHCPQCPFICEAPSKIKCHMEIHEDLKRLKCQHCGKRSNWFWDIRKHIKKDHPGKAMMVATLSEKEARDTLETYLNSPLFRTLSKNSPGRKFPASIKVSKEEVECDVEESEDEDKETDCTSNANVKGDPVKGNEDKIRENESEVIYKSKEKAEDAEKEPEEAKEENNNTMKILTGSSRGKKYRPYKCSACPRRSNWRWDIMKHIRKIHPSAKMITLSEDVAKATFSESVMKRPKGQGLKAQKKVEKDNKEKDVKEQENKPTKTVDLVSKNKSSTPEDDAVMINSVKNIKVKSKVAKDAAEANVPFKKRKLEVKEEIQLKILKQSPRKKRTIPRASVPETIPKSPKKAKVETIRCKGSKDNSKTKPNIPGVDRADETTVKNGPNGKPILRCLKRYKCYYCPYRSNYRSDIGRHGKRLHRKQQLKVVILDEEEAASTLQDYRQKYAKKKFVLAADDINERVRRKPKQNEKSNQSKNEGRPIQVEWMSELAELAKSSERINFSKCFAKNVINPQSSRILLDQSNMLTRCYDHDAMGSNRHSEMNGSVRQLLNGATTTTCMNRENALPN